VEDLKTNVTLHVLPSFSDGADFTRLYNSIKPLLPLKIISHHNQDLWKIVTLSQGTKWWMYFYDNEWLSPDLIKALPTYFNQSHNTYDAYTLKKQVVYFTGSSKYFDTPRIFANYIKLRSGSLMPLLTQEIRPEFILDGMLYCSFEKSNGAPIHSGYGEYHG